MPDRITSVGNGVDSVADTPESRILSEVALFRGLPTEQLSNIESRLRRKTFPAGAQVIIAEEPDETVYVLLERRSLASYAPWVGATNNGAERSARAFRHLQAPHYDFRRSQSIDDAIKARAWLSRERNTVAQSPTPGRCARGRKARRATEMPPAA